MKNRWLVALAGTITMVCLGTVYSWSLFSQPLIAGFGWSATTTVWTFSTAIFFLGVGAILQLPRPFRLLASGGPTFSDGGGAASYHGFVALGLDF